MRTLLKMNARQITKLERRQAVRNLQRGLAALREDGWCQGVYQNDKTGAKCAWGAVVAPYTSKGKYLSSYDERLKVQAHDTTLDLLISGIQKVTGKPVKNVGYSNDTKARVFSWNDRKGRQAGEVKRAFAAAIKIGERLPAVRG